MALAVCLAGCLPLTPAANLYRETRRLPILMYHSILRDPAKQGKYILSPDRLEADIRWLLEMGYETVSTEDVTDFVLGGGTLPEKPVLLTFDDGYLNNLTYVLPLMEQYGCHGVVSVVGVYSERFSQTPDPNPNYAHLSWDEIMSLTAGGYLEIQNHSWDMHGQSGRRGSTRKSGETEAAYRVAFAKDVNRLQEALARETSITPTYYTYPFGLADPLSGQLLQELGFTGSFTCRERINTLERGNPACLFGLGRFNRPGETATSAFMEHVFDETA